jgi:PAS domain-containing protein
VLSEPVATSADEPDATPLTALGSTLLTAVQALGRELDTVQKEVDARASARLGGARDELAAIHDEMHQQQLEISELLAGAGSSRAAMIRRFLSTIPLATVLTSRTGKIIEANAAAHAAMRMPLGTLAGKPIFAYIAQDDRRQLRSTLSASVADDELRQATARVTPRHSAAVECYFALVRETGGQATGAGVDESAADRATDPSGGQDEDSAQLAARAEDSAEPNGPDDGSAPAVDDESASGPMVRWVILPDYESVEGPPSHLQLEALTRLCRLGADDGDLRATLTQVARLCLQASEEASAVSLQVGDPLEPTMTVATSATAQHLDGLQHARAGGPSFDAYRSRRPVALDGAAVTEHHGLADDEQARSVHSLLAVPLVTDELPTGVLTVYASGERSVATLAALRQVMPFVEAAQTLIRDTRAHEEMRRTQEQLESALLSRAVIDQAKGMIMISLKCNADDAFAHLVRMSSTRHEKVRDVAQRMVDDVLTKRSRLLAKSSE